MGTDQGCRWVQISVLTRWVQIRDSDCFRSEEIKMWVRRLGGYRSGNEHYGYRSGMEMGRD